MDNSRRKNFANAVIQENIDIICLTETWPTQSLPDTALYLSDFKIHRGHKLSHSKDSTKHGGVLEGVWKSLAFQKLTIPNFSKEDFVCGKVITKSNRLLIASVLSAFSNSRY